MRSTTGDRSSTLYQHAVASLATPTAPWAPQWWRAKAAAARAHFLQQGLPTHRSEAYRYMPMTRLGAGFEGADSPAPAATPPPKSVLQLPGHHIILRQGRVHHCPQLPRGVVIRSFDQLTPPQEALLQSHLGVYADGKDPLIALNTAGTEQGLLLTVAAGVKLHEPLYLHDDITATTSSISHPRFLIHLGAGSHSQIAYLPYGTGSRAVWANGVTEMVLEREALLHSYMLPITATPSACLCHHVTLVQQADSQCHAYTIAAWEGILRHSFAGHLVGSKSCIAMHGGYLGQGNAHMAHHLHLTHAVPHTQGTISYKGIAYARSSHLFHGLVTVKPQAQHTIAKQSHHGWLLDDRARIYTRPELAIHADDVICQHGATIASAREEALRYLQARGIPSAQAWLLLLNAFWQEPLAAIPLAALRQHLQHHLHQQCSRWHLATAAATQAEGAPAYLRQSR